MKAPRQALLRLAEAHRSLLERARRTRCTCPDVTLSLGTALELDRTLIGFIPEPARAFLDESVIETMDADGATIAENLAHLASLRESDPRSAEIKPLAAALLTRVQSQLELHDRVVFRPLTRFYLESEIARKQLNPTGDAPGRDAAPDIAGDEHDDA